MASLHPQHGVENSEKQTQSHNFNRHSYSAPIEDVTIPAHLLRATGNLGSVRDNDHDLAWEPQQPLMADEEKGIIGRKESIIRKESLARRLTGRSTTRPTRSTSKNIHNSQRSGRLSVTFNDRSQRQDTEAPLSEEEVAARKKNRHQSWQAGEQDIITVSRPSSLLEPALRTPGRTATKNPFEPPQIHINHSNSSSVWSNDDPFATRNNSVVDGSDKSYKEPDNAFTPAGQRQRKGTIGSIVDAVVPDGLARKMTNASFSGLQRKGSVWKTYEHAKKRGVELQRKKWVQVVFEYSIYLFLLCFVYFVLIGRPLWNGAVWWLYWVVENKFVFAGGFSITLGIALL